MSRPVREVEAATRRAGLLALFPGFGAAGGVQASGRMAWEAVAARAGSGFREVHLFCYEAPANGATGGNGSLMARASSKLRAVAVAFGRRWPVELVLVWHLGLLRLVPFFRVPDARVVLFLHGIEAWRPQSALIRLLLRRVDLFLSNSEHTWRRFVSFNPQLGDAPHRPVRLGVGTPAGAAAPAPGWPPSALMVSRLLRSEDYKGHREILAAWPRVLERIPEAELWIAGDGDLRPQLEERARESGLQGRVRFLGNVSDGEKQDLLARCRCLAMPSRGEGFGLVYAEAMRMGRPCLVGTADGGKEVVNPPEAGLAADPANLRDLAGAVCRLLTPGPEWERWSAEARRRYERHFTAEHFQERLLAALRDDSRS